MGQDLAQLLCPECGTPGESDPGASRWQCNSCGNAFYLRRCSACAGISYVDGLQGFRMPWPCGWCGLFNKGFRPNRDPAAATAAELVAEVARYGQAGGGQAPGGQAAGPGPRGRADGGPAPEGGAGAPDAKSSPSGPPPVMPQLARWKGRIALLIAVAAAGIVAASVLLAVQGTVAVGMPAGTAGQGGATRNVHVAADKVGHIDFQGVPGQLTIVGTESGQVTLTGQLRGTGSAPAIESRLNRTSGVLRLSIRCPAAGPCTQNLRLAVPGGAATTVRQPSGRIIVAGLAASLSITAASVDITASGLRSPSLAAVITSGHLSATFATPPSEVSITLASAQATLRLPASTAYRVTQQVTSGYLKIGVPQAGTATRSVAARIDSGET